MRAGDCCEGCIGVCESLEVKSQRGIGQKRHLKCYSQKSMKADIDAIKAEEWREEHTVGLQVNLR